MATNSESEPKVYAVVDDLVYDAGTEADLVNKMASQGFDGSEYEIVDFMERRDVYIGEKEHGNVAYTKALMARLERIFSVEKSLE